MTMAQAHTAVSAAPYAPAASARRIQVEDRVFFGLTLVSAVLVAGLLIAVLVSLLVGLFKLIETLVRQSEEDKAARTLTDALVAEGLAA